MYFFFRWNPLYEFISISFIYTDIHHPSSKRAQYMDVVNTLQNYTSFSFCFCYCCCCCSSPSFLSQQFFFSIWFIRFCAIHMMNNNKPLYKLLVTYDYIFYGFENICYSRLLLLLLFFISFLWIVVYNKLHMWLNWTERNLCVVLISFPSWTINWVDFGFMRLITAVFFSP